MPAHALDGRRVLVTGATGFVGRQVVRTLAEESTAALRLLTRRGTVDDLPAAARAGAELVRGDLLDAANLDSLCTQVDLVVHTATATPGRPVARGGLDAVRRLNLDATLTLAMRAAAAGVRRFVLLSSADVVGGAAAVVVDETTPCAPAGPQAVTLLMAEEALLELGARTGLEVAIVRPCLTAGEGQRGGPLLALFQLCRKGLFPAFGLEGHRALVDVEDVARALLLAGMGGRPGEVYLVASGVRHTLGEVLAVAGGLVGNPRPYLRLPAPLARVAALAPGRLDLFVTDRSLDIGKARRELGFSPHFRDLRSMLARTYAWYGLSGQL